MRAYRGYYGLIQYCPDPGRAEAANIGVIVFCPELQFIDARISDSNERIRRFFGRESFDPARVNAAKRAIKSRLGVSREHFRCLEDFERFAQGRANELLITRPRPMRVEDPDSDLDRLCKELVGVSVPREKTSARIPELDELFRQPSLSGRVEFDKQVTVPVLERPLKVPYAYRNGTLNLVKPQSFSGAQSAAIGAAERTAIEGDLLRRYPEEPDGQRCLIVIPTFETQALEQHLGARIGKLFGLYGVRTVFRNQIEQLAAEVEQLHR